MATRESPKEVKPLRLTPKEAKPLRLTSKEAKPFRLTWPGGGVTLERVKIMGILNITPDSFSDGGKFFNATKAVEHAWRMQREGADLLDVGAESTRPGAEAVDEKTERGRLAPVLERLQKENYPLPISIDTTKPALADEVLERGWAQIVNDVEGLRNSEMVRVVRARKVPVILMHMFGEPRTMQQDYHYDDVVTDLIRFFERRVQETGLHENVVLDPGIGFGKSVTHNLLILKRLREFERLGHPILVGASRKSFIGQVLNVEKEERLEGSLAAAVTAAQNGASILRVHDVLPTLRAIRLAEAVERAGEGYESRMSGVSAGQNAPRSRKSQEIQGG